MGDTTTTHVNILAAVVADCAEDVGAYALAL